MDNLQKLLQDAENTVQHFRDHLDPEDPEGKKHVANSNRAFGADCVLDLIKEAIERDQWEYGATFIENGQNARGFPSFWTTNLKEAKEDLDWHSKRTAIHSPNRKWRIVKRRPITGSEELNDQEKLELEGMEDND